MLKNSTIGNECFVATEFKNRWMKFRETLRREDQLVWDEMWKATEVHKDAIAAGEGNEFEKQFMAMMIEKRKIDDDLEQRISWMERRVKETGRENEPEH